MRSPNAILATMLVMICLVISNAWAEDRQIVSIQEFSKYYPEADQILALIGLPTVDLRLIPSGLSVGITGKSAQLGALRRTIATALGKIPSIGFAVDRIITDFELRSLVIKGTAFEKTIVGTITGEIAIVGKTIKFSDEGEINIHKLISVYIDQIVPTISTFAADTAKIAYEKAKVAAVRIGTYGLSKIDSACNTAAAITKESAYNFRIFDPPNYHKILSTFLPLFINDQGDPLIKESNKVLDDLYRQILPLVRNASSIDERNQLIALVYNPVNATLDTRWEQLANDRTVTKWTILTARKNELYKQYREGINAKYQQQKMYRDELHQRLITAQPLIRIPSDAKTSLDFIAALSKSAVPVVIQLKTENLAWDLPQADGSMNQQWVFVSAGKPDTYFIKCVLGNRYIHISEAKDTKGSSLIIGDSAANDLPQTMFTVTADPDGYIRFSTVNGLAFELQDGIMKDDQTLHLEQKNGGDSQAFYVLVPIELLGSP